MAFWDGWSEEEQRSGKRMVFGLGAMLAVLFAFFIWSDSQMEEQRQQAAPWAEMARAAVLGQPQPKDAIEPGGGYIRGRVLPVNKKRREVDPMHFQLPAALRSQKPDDVGMFAVLTDGQRQVGKYDDGSPAYVYTLDVQLIDRARNVTIARHTLEGGPPPEKKMSSSTGIGSYPMRETIAYLASLPKR